MDKLNRHFMPNNPDLYLSLVIPAYNEENRLPTSLRDIKSFFKNFPYPMEVLVVVEKSADRTLELAQHESLGEPRLQVIDNRVHRGKGYAVRSGMQKTRGRFVFFMDADLSTPLTEVLRFLAHFEDHPQTHVIVGSRSAQDSQVLKRQNRIRQNMGKIFNRFVQMFAVRGITDTQCGFKAFRHEAAAKIFPLQKINAFAFDVEILLLAQKLGYNIDILGVKWVNSPESKVRIIRDSLKMLWDLIRVRWIVHRSLREKLPSS